MLLKKLRRKKILLLGAILFLLLATIVSVYLAGQRQTVVKRAAEPTGIPKKAGVNLPQLKDKEKLLLLNRFSYSSRHLTPLNLKSEVGKALKNRYEEISDKKANNWYFRYDEQDKIVRQIVGNISIAKLNLPGISSASKNNIENITKAFISQNNNLFKQVDFSSLTFKKIHSTGKINTAVFLQNYKGIPVYGGFFNLTTSNNRIILVDNYYFYNINLYTKPVKTTEEAIKFAKDYFGIKSDEKSTATLMIYPEITDKTTIYYLSYKVDLPLSRKPLSRYSVFVDVQTGKILDSFDNIINENLNGRVSGMIFLHDLSQTQVERPSKNNEIKLMISPSPVVANTDSEGNYQFTNLSPGTYNLEADLSGPWVDVFNEEQTRTASHQAQIFVPSTHDWNWGESISPTPPFDQSTRQVESNVFYDVNIAHDFFTKDCFSPNCIPVDEERDGPFNIAEVNYKLPSFVGYAAECNGGFSFLEPHLIGVEGGPNCLSDVVYHEYTHFVTFTTTINLPYHGQTGNLNEGWSDYFACSLNNDPCLNKEATGPYCVHRCKPDTGQAPRVYDETVCNDEPHACAEVISQALWEIREGASRKVADNLTILAEKLQPIDFADFLMKVILADAEFYFPITHRNLICRAFENHGITVDPLAGMICDDQLPIGVITIPPEKGELKDTTNIQASFCPSNNASSSTYSLELGEGSDPSSWTPIAHGGPFTGCQSSVALFSFNPAIYKKGSYTLKLTITDNLNNTNSSFRHFSIPSFNIEAVDDSNTLEEDNSLIIDPNNHPHIIYRGSYDFGALLRYAHHNGTSWEIRDVDTEYYPSGYSLALDANNQPHISYCNSYGILKYAVFDGTSWSQEIVDADAHSFGSRTSLILDTMGQPHISYGEGHYGNLKYAHYINSEHRWDIQAVDTESGVGAYSSLVLDSSGQPHISYSDTLNGDLKYAHYRSDTHSWDIQRVDSEGDTGYETSLALDTNGRPHISYLDFTNEDLKYTYHNGTSWNIKTIDSGGKVGWYSSLTLDSNGIPHIGYFDKSSEDLKYATLTGTAWDIQIVEGEGSVGWYPSLALDSNNNPHIAYFDWTSHKLKYASFIPQLSCFDQNHTCGGNISCCTGLSCQQGRCLASTPTPTPAPATTVTIESTQIANAYDPCYSKRNERVVLFTIRTTPQNPNIKRVWVKRVGWIARDNTVADQPQTKDTWTPNFDPLCRNGSHPWIITDYKDGNYTVKAVALNYYDGTIAESDEITVTIANTCTPNGGTVSDCNQCCSTHCETSPLGSTVCIP